MDPSFLFRNRTVYPSGEAGHGGREARPDLRLGITGNDQVQGGRMLNPGDKAPDFVGRDHTGKTVKLSDFKGKPVVLWFFPKANSPG
jgi:peroxiredoxin Q/BCP